MEIWTRSKCLPWSPVGPGGARWGRKPASQISCGSDGSDPDALDILLVHHGAGRSRTSGWENWALVFWRKHGNQTKNWSEPEPVHWFQMEQTGQNRRTDQNLKRIFVGNVESSGEKTGIFWKIWETCDVGFLLSEEKHYGMFALFFIGGSVRKNSNNFDLFIPS